jgi:formiminoglutamate deiminase
VTSFWCEHAVIDRSVRARVRIETADGEIVAVVPDTAAMPTDRKLAGLVLPGLANAHSHAFHRALRGRTHSDGGTFWTWRDLMYRVADRLTPDSYFDLARATFAEMVLAGYTVVGEFHYLHAGSGAMEDAVLSAAAEAGIRITLLDTLYLDGGLDPDGSTVGLSASQRRFSDLSVENWQARRSAVSMGPLARGGAAVHSIRAVDPRLLSNLVELVAGDPLHAHLSEQSAENTAALAAWGVTPTRLFADAGLLGENFTAVHGTHLSDDDIELLGQTGSTVCFCPTTERDLGDGIGPASALAAAGARLALGSDQHAVIDPFEELRGLEMHERLAAEARGRFDPAELLEHASANGYSALGWNGGTIRVGALADLVAVDTGSVRTAGAALDQLWFAATAADVTTVVIAGEIVVDDRRHAFGDVGELLAEAIAKVGT